MSVEKGRSDEFELYAAVERLAPKVIAQERKMYKGVSANVDFYSGFVYDMLALPMELYTPIFAMSRIVGWSAHRIEELVNAGKSSVLLTKQSLLIETISREQIENNTIYSKTQKECREFLRILFPICTRMFCLKY